MLLTDYLFNEVKNIWEEYLNHPFIKEMGEGILDKEKFRRYLIQDFLYLKEYAKVYGMGLVKSENIEEMKFFKDSINGIMEDESATHIIYLKDFGEKIEELENYKISFDNDNYTSFMKSIALTGDLLELVVAVLPCAWSYYYIAKEMKNTYADNLDGNFYGPWIKSYSCDDYARCAQKNIDFTNKICGNLDESKKEKLKKIFIQASIYEMKFWDMAYKEV